MSSWFDEAFAGQHAMAILRGYSLKDTIEYAERAWDSGFDLVEVPVQSAEAVEALTQLAVRASERGKFVGAGTVDTLERVRLSAEAGAVFTVAPGFDAEVAQASIAAGLAHLPGVATGSEIQAARKLGLNWVKAFPATDLGTSWFKAMRGPFPDLNLVATGGIGADNCVDYLRAGARLIAVGSALADPQELDRLKESLEKFDRG